MRNSSPCVGGGDSPTSLSTRRTSQRNALHQTFTPDERQHAVDGSSSRFSSPSVNSPRRHEYQQQQISQQQQHRFHHYQNPNDSKQQLQQHHFHSSLHNSQQLNNQQHASSHRSSSPYMRENEGQRHQANPITVREVESRTKGIAKRYPTVKLSKTVDMKEQIRKQLLLRVNLTCCQYKASKFNNHFIPVLPKYLLPS